MLKNPKLASGILAVFGFLLLLLLPFEQLLGSVDSLSHFQQVRIGDFLKNLMIIAYGWVLIHYNQYYPLSGLLKFSPRNSYLLLIPLCFVLVGPVQYFFFDYTFEGISTSDVLVLLFASLSVGLSEEVVFRGFLLPHLLSDTEGGNKLGPICLSGSLFGVLHLLNLFGNDANPVLIVSQIIYATMFGIAFGILLLRTGSLLPIGIIHGLINFSSNLRKLPGATEPGIMDQYEVQKAIIMVLIVLPYLVFMLFELRKETKMNSAGR